MTAFGAVAALCVAAALGRPTAAGAQEERLTQQTQAEVPEDWAERAGICRRTERGCEGRSSTATRLAPEEGVVVDGVPEEDIWRRADWITDFIQLEPVEGATTNRGHFLRPWLKTLPLLGS